MELACEAAEQNRSATGGNARFCDKGIASKGYVDCRDWL